MSGNQIDPSKPATPAPTRSMTPDKNNVVPSGMSALFSNHHTEALKGLYTRVVQNALDVEEWYRTHKAKKKWGASLTRIGAVLLTAAATMTPIVRELWPVADPNNAWKPVPFAALFAALAATCIALDKLLGFSSGWMRYISAMMELQTKIDAFHFDWNQWVLEEQTDPRTPKEAMSKALALLSELLADVREVLNKETLLWATEFKRSLADLDKFTEAQRAAASALPSTGSIRLKVKNAEQLDDKSFKVQLDEGLSLEGSGSTFARNNLQPGQVRVRAFAKKGQVAVSAENIALIKPGEIADVELELV
ncbi:MAG: SLATT domain-containing protein [Archangium sp.]